MFKKDFLSIFLLLAWFLKQCVCVHIDYMRNERHIGNFLHTLIRVKSIRFIEADFAKKKKFAPARHAAVSVLIAPWSRT
jgi:hypothetical protein